MAREELKWQNIDADDLPAAVKKSFDAMVEAESTFKADLEKLVLAPTVPVISSLVINGGLKLSTGISTFRFWKEIK